MSKYEKIKHLAAHEFRRLTGVKIQTFNEMVAIIKEKELRKKKIGRPHNLCIEDRNRRKRFGLRFNLICGIYNYELLLE
jgi:hypothetical protein